MNIERLTKIAEWLEGGALHETITFDMTRGFAYKIYTPGGEEPPQCGSSCCIAGAAVQFFNDPANVIKEDLAKPWDYESVHEGLKEVPWDMVMDEATELLDLTDRQAKMLFEPQKLASDSLRNYNNAAWAARTIRDFIATGEVDWQRNEGET